MAFINKAKRKTVYVYEDIGSGRESVLHTMLTLQNNFSHRYRINKITAAEVINGEWLQDAALLIMPGGADLGYVKKLNGKGNANIKNYVEKGGSYLGICAGAYYAAAYVEFANAILGARELSFFAGKAIGPVLAKYNKLDESGARAAEINTTIAKIHVYYNGGGYFENAAKIANVEIIGFYQNNLPAIIHISCGQGNVVLSGVHFEYDPSLLDRNNQYLKAIIPQLRADEKHRHVLVMEIFRRLI